MAGRRARSVVGLVAALGAAMGLGVVVTTAGQAGAVVPASSSGLVVATSTSGAPVTGTAAAGTPVGGTGATGQGTTSGGAAHEGATGADERARLEHALARRQAVLSSLTASVQHSGVLSSTVRQTLESQLAAATSAIDGLASAVPGDPATQLAPAASTMVDKYRVYLVMVPKVRLAEKAGRQANAESKATAAEPRIAARIQAAAAAGTTVQAARQADTDLVAKVTAATADTEGAGIPAVLAVTPAGYPADKAPIVTARSELKAARSVLPAVRTDLHTIRTAVKGSASGS